MPKKIPIFILLTLFISTSVFAAEIYKVKNRKAIVHLQGLDVETGDILLVQDIDGTEKARVKVTQVKNSMALVQILNGEVHVGDSVIRATNRDVSEERSLASDIDDVDESSNENFEEEPTETDTYQPPPSPVTSQSEKRFGLGFFGGVSWNIMHRTEEPIIMYPASESISGDYSRDMKTGGFGLIAKAAVDYNISKVFGLRVLAGWQQFRTSNHCTSLDTVFYCKKRTDLLILSTHIQYYFFSRSDIIRTWRTWIGIGGGLIIPSKDALDRDITTTGTVIVGIGGNKPISSKLDLISQIDFNYLISSERPTYFIGFQVGLMYFL